MIQAVLVFLIVIAALAVGRRFLGPPPSRRSGPPIEAARRCPTCKAYVVGKTPEPCDRADCPFR